MQHAPTDDPREARRLFDLDVALSLARGEIYEDIAGRHACSVGKVYAAAVRAGARKNEGRIRGRRERERLQAEFLAAAMNQTLRADVLAFLEGLPSDSVDAFFTSPPYNVGKDYRDSKDAMLPLAFDGWMRQIIAQMERVAKPGGVVGMVVGGTRDRHGRIYPLDWLLKDAFRETGLTYQNRVVWPTAHGLTPSRRLSERHETVMVYSKGEPAVFNPDPGRTPQKQYDKRAFRGPRRGEATSHPLGAWPSDVWSDVRHVGNNHGEKTAHRAQFSEALVRKFLSIYTNAGALACDPFSGSGTTQKWCYENLRDFVGSDPCFEDIREARMALARRATFCPFPGVTPESMAFWEAELSGRGAAAQPGAEPWRAPVRAVEVRSPGLFDALGVA